MSNRSFLARPSATSGWQRLIRRIRDVVGKGRSLVPRLDAVRPVRVRISVQKPR